MRSSTELEENLSETREEFKKEFSRDMPDELLRNILLRVLDEKMSRFLGTRYRDWGISDVGKLLEMVSPKPTEGETVKPTVKRGRVASKGDRGPSPQVST